MGANAPGVTGHFNFCTSAGAKPLFRGKQYLTASPLGAESILHAKRGNPTHLFLPVHQVKTVQGDEGHDMPLDLPHKNLVVLPLVLTQVSLGVIEGDIGITQLFEELLNGRPIQ